MRSALTEANLIITPVVEKELLTREREAVVVIFNEEARVDLACHYVWDFLVVELKEVGEGFCEEEAWEGNGCDFVRNERREVFTFLTLGFLTLLCH